MIKKVYNIFFSIGTRIFKVLDFAGFTFILFFKSVYYTKNIFSKFGEILKQMYFSVVKTFPVISIVGMFTGMILTLQTGIELQEYHMEHKIGNVLIATLTREMGPFTAAIILIAAVGSAMAAEVGTMKVSEEIDALDIMSISPVKFLVMPRVVALSLMLPIATIYVNILGCIGGSIIAKTHLGMSFETIYLHILESLHFKAVYVGLLKSFVFGILISCISCGQGLRASGGALGVGKATRDSVVISFIMVLIVGYFITEIFFREGL